MKRAVAAAMLLSALALIAAACGGSGNPDKQANEAYASGVCTAVDTWVTEVKSLATVPSSGITKAAIDSKLSQFETATKKLISQIKAVPAPNTSEGQAAKKQIGQLAAQVQTTSTAVKSTAAALPANATLPQMLSALSKLLPQFQTLQTNAQSTLDSIRGAGGSLASAFKSESACKQLG